MPNYLLRKILKRVTSAITISCKTCFCVNYNLNWLVRIGQQLEIPVEILCSASAGYGLDGTMQYYLCIFFSFSRIFNDGEILL